VPVNSQSVTHYFQRFTCISCICITCISLIFTSISPPIDLKLAGHLRKHQPDISCPFLPWPLSDPFDPCLTPAWTVPRHSDSSPTVPVREIHAFEGVFPRLPSYKRTKKSYVRMKYVKDSTQLIFHASSLRLYQAASVAEGAKLITLLISLRV
jgi:hypothetical protein